MDLFIYFAQRFFFFFFNNVLSLGFLISSSSMSGEGERWGKGLAKTRLGSFLCIFSRDFVLVMKGLTQEFEVHQRGVGRAGGSQEASPPQLPSAPVGWPPATLILEGLGQCWDSLVALSSLRRKWLLLLSGIWGVGFGVCLASLAAQMVRNLPAMWETWVRSLVREDLPEKGMATHSSILACRQNGQSLQSIDCQRVRHDWATNTFTFRCF